MNEDLRAAERAFNDVHKKYERTKEAIGEFKRNEDSLKVKCDTSCCAKPPVYFKTKVPLLPGKVRPGQAKTELLFLSQREFLDNVMCHPVNLRPFYKH